MVIHGPVPSACEYFFSGSWEGRPKAARRTPGTAHSKPLAMYLLMRATLAGLQYIVST